MATRQQQKTKGNPAHTRMANANLKARRAASWARGQKRKAEGAADRKAREQANRLLRLSGQLTPWQQAKAARKARRIAEHGGAST
jgi:hypothetical protein